MLRFAQSPIGDMHIDSLRVALFNHILSKQLKEDLIIRIEDTNKEQNIEGKDKEILEILGLFSIDFTQVLYQGENLKHHSQIAMQLLIKGKAFNCFCTDEKLELDRKKAKDEGKSYCYDSFCEKLLDSEVIDNEKPFTVRIKKPEKNIKFTDKLKGELEYTPFDVDSFIILKKDKTSTYNFACAIDDMLCNISTVVREENHLSDTPKQIHIRQSLGYDGEINYVHLPVLLNMQTGKKISENDEDLGVKKLVNEGFLPSAIANYLVLLAYDAPCEIFTIEEAIEWLDVNKILKESPEFDIKKLRYMNSEHLKLIDDMRLSKLVGFADEDIGKLAKIYIEECDTIKEIKEKIQTVFSKKETLKGFETEFKKVKECLQKAPFIEDFNEFEKYIASQTKLKDKQLSVPLRFALTGSTSGANLSDIYPLIKNYLGEIIK